MTKEHYMASQGARKRRGTRADHTEEDEVAKRTRAAASTVADVPDQAASSAAPTTMHNVLDIVLSFDATLSMTPVINSVREQLRQLTTTMFDSGVASVRMAVIAHGDYDTSYVTRSIDFTDDVAALTAFITDVPPAPGCWNDGECYEQALQMCVSSLSWRPDSKKVVVVVGDDIPHEANYAANTNRTDWREQVRLLSEMGVCIFAVQCASLAIPRAEYFYRGMAQAHPDGRYLLLTQFYMMSELVMGIFFAARNDTDSLADHEQSLIQRGMHNQHMANAFASLRGEDPATTATSGGPPHGLVPVSVGRFQVLPVAKDQSIKAFVQKSGAVFRMGRGFYQLSKPEKISQHKEIVLEEKRTGDMYTGHAARTILGLDPRAKDTLVNPSSPHTAGVLREYNVFIQSNSYNRKLVAPTRFLYELDRV